MLTGKTLLISGVSPKEVARNLGLSIPTLYRWRIRALLAVAFFRFVKLAPFDRIKGTSSWTLVDASLPKIRRLRATPVNVRLARELP